MSIATRSIRNGGILALILSAIGLFQGENLLTAALVFFFAWFIMTGALWLSYKITATQKQKTEKTADETSSDNNDKATQNKDT